MLQPQVEILKNSNESKEISGHQKKYHVPRPPSGVQTLVAGFYINTFMYLPFIFYFFNAFLLLYFNFFGRALLLFYFTYIYFDHKQRLSTVNGNGWIFSRNNTITRHLRDYFPIDLVKTAELPPNRNYVVASFPHGIIGTGITVNMGNNIGKWLELFPGVRPKVATLNMYFCTPFMRELLRSWGLVSCSKEALMLQLDKSNNPYHPHNLDGFTSNAVALLVGGAQEALDSHTGRYVLYLKKRKGFVKIAIRSGSPIVPSFSFGEVDILDQVANPPDSSLRKFQTFVKSLSGIAPLIVTGRGLFRYSFGILPHRRPIVQVMGAPIDVDKMDEPDAKYVDEIHQKVMDSLTELFEKYKHKYLENPDTTQLVIN